jgi:5'-phosphate synthase pdxT subunit
MILLADKIDNDSRSYFGTMPMTVRRNAYGRQLGSFFTEAEFNGTKIPMTFIRAPYISEIGQAECLATVDGKAVAAKYKNQLATAFHPELNDDLTVMEYFLKMV